MTWDGALAISILILAGCMYAVDREIKAGRLILAALYRWDGATLAQLRKLTGSPVMFGPALEYLRERGLVIASAQDEAGDIFTLTSEGLGEAEVLYAGELGA